MLHCTTTVLPDRRVSLFSTPARGCGWAGAPDDDATIRGEATMTSTLRMEVVAFLAVFAFLGAVVLGLF